MSPESDEGVWSATIPGEPIGKGRPRATVRGGFVRTYTPKRTADWERDAAVMLANKWSGAPLEGPASVSLLALFPRPQRMIWKRKPMPREPFTRSPDVDNVAKAVLDALEKAGVLSNDKLVWSLDCVALYCDGDESPRVIVRVGW